jgi:surfactin synthase thioesterase subunit
MKKINLFCLPFAGGSKYSYRGYARYASDDLNVIPIELPGRGTRFKDALLKDAHKMAEDVLNQIRPLLNKPYAIYGHSMGTLIGYLLTRRILEEGLPQPGYLVFTGCGGPSVKYDEPIRYLLPRDEFLAKIRELGGCPEEILQDENMMLFFEPILRSDFQVVETFEYKKEEPFDIPILVMIGLNEKATYEQALAWQEETTAAVEVRQFPGKHFFIFDFEWEIMKAISKLNNKIYKDEKATSLSKA